MARKKVAEKRKTVDDWELCINTEEWEVRNGTV